MTDDLMPHVTLQSGGDAAKTDLAARRTGMAFQRTRLAADRTLMAVIRTALSLIGFGFTIFQFFHKLTQANVLREGSGTARSFGLSLVVLGSLLLVLGIIYHVRFMLGLRHVREEMRRDSLIHAQSGFPVSLTLVTAVLLFLIGLLAVLGMMFDVGPLK
jgi:putative membrane protein